MVDEKERKDKSKRETLIQVEPRLGYVLLGYREYDAFHRGLTLSTIELTPYDAIELAKCLATAADLILNTEQEMTNGDSITIPPTYSNLTEGTKKPG